MITKDTTMRTTALPFRLGLAALFAAGLLAALPSTAAADDVEVIEPVVIPDKGVWHPMAPRVFETSGEYMTWLKEVHAPALGIDANTAPIIGVVLQKSHINTKVHPSC